MFARKVAVAWNAFYRNKTQLNFLKVPDPGAKIVIVGTPFNGRQFDFFEEEELTPPARL